MSDERPSTTDDRLAAVEQQIAELRRAVEELRRAVERRDASPRAPLPPRLPVAPLAPPRRVSLPDFIPRRSGETAVSTLSIERWVGRYGTIALAVLAILAGAGTFLGWAIRHGLLGPVARVGLMLVAAVVTAVLGVRFRSRGQPGFGNVLLGLALALTHVVAWAAGPRLDLVSPAVAVLAAAAASIALAVLAHRADDHALFATGLAGALAAPLVAGGPEGSAPALFAYALTIHVTALWGVRNRSWGFARTLLALGATLYAVLIASQARSVAATQWLTSLFPLVLVAAGGALLRPPFRAAWTRRMLVLGAVALAATSVGEATRTTTVALAALGTLMASVILSELEREQAMSDGAAGFRGLVDGALIPLGFLLVALSDTGLSDTRRVVLLAGSWSALGIGMLARHRDRPQVGGHALLAVIGASIVAVALASPDSHLTVIALCVVAVAAGLGARLAAPQMLGLSALGLLAAMTLWELGGLFPASSRWVSVPFSSPASLATGAVLLGWTALAVTGEHSQRTAARVGALTTAFFWIRAELERTISPPVSTALLIAYYATTGVLAVWVGRARRISAIRHLGLALSSYAAIKVLVQASAIGSIGLRVGLYLLTGVYLLVVARWYRLPLPDEGEPSPAPSAGD